MIIGSRVRVKSWPTIKDTLDGVLFMEESGVMKGNKRMNFATGMKQFCNFETRVTQVYKNGDGETVYSLEDCELWWWHEKWIHDLTHKNILPEELFEI